MLGDDQRGDELLTHPHQLGDAGSQDMGVRLDTELLVTG